MCAETHRAVLIRYGVRGIPRLAALLILTFAAFAQDANTPSHPPAPQEILGFLNQTIDWHRNLIVEEQQATDPADFLFVNDDRQLDRDIVQLSFDFATAETHALPNQNGNAVQGNSRYESLFRGAQQADEEAKSIQDEMDRDRKQLQSARGANRKQLQATLDELQGEVDLARTRSQTIHDLLQFVAGASGGADGLLGQIEQLRQSIPELRAENPPAPGTHAAAIAASDSNGGGPSNAVPRPAEPSGILGLGRSLFSLHSKIRAIDNRSRSTRELTQTAQRFRAPLMANIAAISRQADELAKQADTSNTEQLQQQRPQFDALTSRFKQTSAVLTPLAKQSALFDLYQSNLEHWRESVKAEASAQWTQLLIRIAVVALVLLFVFILAEAWRKATFRYVHDLRRRYQFLLLRRILLWAAAGITIAFALANQLGSMVTFAGLITAGIAVALQNLIMAVAGYFFLIGKYGVRPGDRIQISGVTGDVIDIGLIRLHLMEIGGTSSDGHPSGRVVVFSNAVVFQPTASFFKQIPGTHFVWHEVSLTLTPEGDYRLAEQRMLEAVQQVYAEYRQDIELQHRRMEETLNMSVPLPEPRSRLRLTQNGLEVVIRYPMELQDAAEIDDRITRKLLDALARSPKLRLVGAGTPNIQPVPEHPPEEHKAA